MMNKRDKKIFVAAYNLLIQLLVGVGRRIVMSDFDSLRKAQDDYELFKTELDKWASE